MSQHGQRLVKSRRRHSGSTETARRRKPTCARRGCCGGQPKLAAKSNSSTGMHWGLLKGWQERNAWAPASQASFPASMRPIQLNKPRSPRNTGLPKRSWNALLGVLGLSPVHGACPHPAGGIVLIPSEIVHPMSDPLLGKMSKCIHLTCIAADLSSSVDWLTTRLASLEHLQHLQPLLRASNFQAPPSINMRLRQGTSHFR